MNTESFVAVMAGENRSFGAGLARTMAGVAEPIYRGIVQARNMSFRREWRSSRRLPHTTISVGNITAGGTGKTPMVAALAIRLVGLGFHPAVLMRGYMPNGSDDQGSDERQVLLKQLEAANADVPVHCDGNRVNGAREVLKTHPKTNVFVLDDGFQHRQVYRELDLVLIDATRPFGLDRVLPRGLLREPVKNLRRANGLIVTRANQVSKAKLEEITDRLVKVAGQPPIAYAAHVWVSLRVAMGEVSAEVAVDQLKGRRVVVVCGIGNPGAFRQSLEKHGAVVAQMDAYDDHYTYTAEDVTATYEAARQHKASVVVMTEKDYVKWEHVPVTPPSDLQVVRPRLMMGFMNGDEHLNRMMLAAMRPSGEFTQRRAFRNESLD